ncbi:annexin A2 [Boleophthalmus pectinirostris]|uniref:annexin A2 n=1 Tax=Boleophthalmus pectinirostris TaxID=150288 RepID=UPI000A1C70B9|nr:annexin A2 [Boleophthalmus pectinirostris]
MDADYYRSEMYWGTLGTVRPHSNFHPDRDVMELQTALEKKDCANIVRILTNRNNAQRQVLVKTFEELTQKDLSSTVKKALSGDVETLLLELLMPPLHYEAYRLEMAMVGLGTDEESLLEILCTLTGPQLKEISEIYKQMYKKDLEKELKGETSGDFAKLVVALLNKSDVAGLVYKDVETLVATLNGKKCEAAPWIDILTSRDPEHLQKVLDEVEFQTGLFLDEALEKRFSGDFRLGLKVLVQCIQNPDLYLAKRISTMKIPQTQRVMVSHCEEDLLCIRAAFIKLTGNSLYSTLQKHFKGDFLTALLNICRSED